MKSSACVFKYSSNNQDTGDSGIGVTGPITFVFDSASVLTMHIGQDPKLPFNYLYFFGRRYVVRAEFDLTIIDTWDLLTVRLERDFDPKEVDDLTDWERSQIDDALESLVNRWWAQFTDHEKQVIRRCVVMEKLEELEEEMGAVILRMQLIQNKRHGLRSQLNSLFSQDFRL